MSDFGAVSRSRPTGQANLRCPDASRIDRGELFRWIDDRLDHHRAERSEARRDGDEYGSVFATGASLELHELLSWITLQGASAMNAQAKVEKPDARQMFEASAREGLIEDATNICRAVRYVEVAPARLFDASLVSELADASDRLAAKVADLQERQGAGR